MECLAGMRDQTIIRIIVHDHRFQIKGIMEDRIDHIVDHIEHHDSVDHVPVAFFRPFNHTIIEGESEKAYNKGVHSDEVDIAADHGGDLVGRQNNNEISDDRKHQ